MAAQTTIRSELAVEGIGLHKGEAARVWLRPAAPDTGVVFVAHGRPDRTPIPARWDWVVGQRLATTLGNAQWQVSTVEHLLAAAICAGLHNLEVVVDGPELPILDGSAQPWLVAFAQAGLTALNRPLRPWGLREPVVVEDGERSLALYPQDHLSLDVEVAFPHPAVGVQRLEIAAPDLAQGLGWARTFGFLKQARALHRMGLALGASLDNTVVYDDEGPMNPGGLRAKDEAVRHKALDLLGDLALLGRPLCARVVARRPGHGLTHQLLTRLSQEPAALVSLAAGSGGPVAA